MIRHIGKHNERKVVILFRQVPGEDHMCLLVYSDVLPRLIHDELMRTLESAPGQQADNLAEALHRIIMGDGRNALEVIHKEGFMKKVQTSQVIMTPNAASKIRLDELNTMLAEMAKGDDAVKRMAELDNSSGLQTKKRDNSTPARDVGDVAKKPDVPVVPPLQAPIDGVLSDEAIAKQQLSQAAKMRAEATSLMNEAVRLEADAAALLPKPAPTPVIKAPRKTATKATNDNTITQQKAKKAQVNKD